MLILINFERRELMETMTKDETEMDAISNITKDTFMEEISDLNKKDKVISEVVSVINFEMMELDKQLSKSEARRRDSKRNGDCWQQTAVYEKETELLDAKYQALKDIKKSIENMHSPMFANMH